MAGDEFQNEDDVVSVLLHPSVVPVLDLFRSTSELEPAHDLAALAQAERELNRWTSSALARAIVSDATLLAFAVARERSQPFTYQVPGSRRMSADERNLIALVGAARAWGRRTAIEEAATALGLPREGASIPAAEHLSSRIEQAGLPWPAWDLVGGLASIRSQGDQPMLLASADDAAFRFKT
jgi:hypothetical protein